MHSGLKSWRDIIDSREQVTRHTYAGLFLVTLATLMWEILLTRMFSISMWYHYAFIAISVGMFGMTVGAIFVYLKPDYFTDARIKYHLTLYSLLFAVTLFFCSLIYMSIPFVMEDRSVVALFSIVLSYIVISVPFFFSGVCVCLTLTRFPDKVGRLYGADLAGAALGCIVIIFALRITDGPTAILVISALAYGARPQAEPGPEDDMGKGRA